MRQLRSLADVIAASGADPQCIWAAQGLRSGGMAWAHADGAAVACPGLAGQDRLIVRGSVDAADALIREALPALGLGYLVIGDPEIMSSLAGQWECLEPSGRFAWMDGTALPRQQPVHEARWLARREWETAEAVFLGGAPTPEVWRPQGRRWAGISDATGSLTCVAVEAWSTPGIGFMAGLASEPEVRGTGQGFDLSAFLLRSLLATHGRFAVMTLEEPAGVVRMFGRLGMSCRPQQVLKVQRRF